MKNDREFISLCLAVVEGRLSPQEARSALRAGSEAERSGCPETARALYTGRPERAKVSEGSRREESLDIWKELFVQPPPEDVLLTDQALAGLLVEQRLISPGQAWECLGLQKRAFESGRRPLPRLGALILRQGFLAPGAGRAGSGEDGAGLADPAFRAHALESRGRPLRGPEVPILSREQNDPLPTLKGVVEGRGGP